MCKCRSDAQSPRKERTDSKGVLLEWEGVGKEDKEGRRTEAGKEQGTEATKEQADMTKHFHPTLVLQSTTLLIIQLLQPLGQAVAQVLWISNSKILEAEAEAEEEAEAEAENIVNSMEI